VYEFWKECNADPDSISQRMTEVGLDSHPTKDQIRSRIRTHEFNNTRVLMGLETQNSVQNLDGSDVVGSSHSGGSCNDVGEGDENNEKSEGAVALASIKGGTHHSYQQVVHLTPWRINLPNNAGAAFIYSKKAPTLSFAHEHGVQDLQVTFLWPAPKEEELHEGLKEMTFVKNRNLKYTVDPTEASSHAQLAQFTLEPKSITLPLHLDEGLEPVGYQHFESSTFDLVLVANSGTDYQ